MHDHEFMHALHTHFHLSGLVFASVGAGIFANFLPVLCNLDFVV